MQFKLKYIFCLHKSYFDKGMSITNYLKYLIAFFALASDNIFYTMIIAFIYGIGSYLIGLIWFKYGFVKAETEVFNDNNLFVKEMRKRFK